MKGKLYYITFLLFLFLSCNRSTNNNIDNSVLVDSVIETLSTEKQFLFNNDKFTVQLDSLLLIFEDNVSSFEYEFDTLEIKTSNENKAQLRNGLFESLYSVYLDTVIIHHYFVPKTKKVLRIYLLEAIYSDTTMSKMRIESLKKESQSQSPVEDGDYYLLTGLTMTNDYLIRQANKIYWLNVACQYSKNEYYEFIECFKANLNNYSESDSIICFCGGECSFN